VAIACGTLWRTNASTGLEALAMMSSLVNGCDITGDVAAFVREQDQEAKGTKSGGRVAPGTPNASCKEIARFHHRSSQERASKGPTPLALRPVSKAKQQVPPPFIDY